MIDPTARAWAYLSRVAEPPCAQLAALVRCVGPVEAADRVRRGQVGNELAQHTGARRGIDRAADDLELLMRRGGRLITPDDDEWPVLAFAAFSGAGARARPCGHSPLVLWALGPARLDEVAPRAAAVVGTRAATAYGEHVAADLAAGLAERDVAVVSGGAYGIDGAAHRAALDSEGITVAVLAGGFDIPYPAGHSALLHRIARAVHRIPARCPSGPAPVPNPQPVGGRGREGGGSGGSGPAQRRRQHRCLGAGIGPGGGSGARPGDILGIGGLSYAASPWRGVGHPGRRYRRVRRSHR